MRTQKRQITLLSTVPLFEALNDRELELLSRRVRRLHAEPGDILVLEGQRGREFFVILSGQAAVMHDDDTVATLRTGDWFGELALLANAPRSATVAALTPMELFVLDDSAARRHGPTRPSGRRPRQLRRPATRSLSRRGGPSPTPG